MKARKLSPDVSAVLIVDMMNASHLCDLAEENFIRTFPGFNFQPEGAQNYGLLLSFHLIEVISDSFNDGVNLLKFIRGNRRKGMLTTTVSLKICDIKYVLNILPTTVSFCVQSTDLFMAAVKKEIDQRLARSGSSWAGTSEMKAWHFENFWSIQTKRTENTKDYKSPTLHFCKTVISACREGTVKEDDEHTYMALTLYSSKPYILYSLRQYLLDLAYEHVFEFLDLHEESFPGIRESCEENRPPGS
ncbi:hypothetical protein NC651_005143 [Populus alba x Populus x berolinensis]|nr:hypothetical protein NC651_005143 [Populus alba x Populus x berolinensis]